MVEKTKGAFAMSFEEFNSLSLKEIRERLDNSAYTITWLKIRNGRFEGTYEG